MNRAITVACLLLVLSPIAQAVKIADVTRIEGQQENVLTGMGLVVGLAGSGDGGDYLPAIRSLATMLSHFSNESQLTELSDVKNVALVWVTVRVPRDGANEGDKLDVRISSAGKATSLKGGHLVICPLTGPGKPEDWDMIAQASGFVDIEDPTTATSGVIKGGCTMQRRIQMEYIVDGKLPLVIDSEVASWKTASTIASIINDSEANGRDKIAVALSPTLVSVSVPQAELEQPSGFIARVLNLPVTERLLKSESRVVINTKKTAMVIDGDVEIGPTAISYKGLSITTTTPAREPTPQAPAVNTKNFVSVDTTNTGGGKLQDLMNALEQLKVPPEDRIAIIEELHKSGRLHAKLIVEN